MNVTVGIPTLNGPDRLARALEAIHQFTDWNRLGRIENVRLLVCDDGSTPENLAENRRLVHDVYKVLEEKADLELLENGERRGIAASWNRLVRQQPSDVVILLNDDIEVATHWLDVLVYSVTQNRRAGMVACTSYVALTRGQHRAAYNGLVDHVLAPRIDYQEARLLSNGGQLLASSGSAFAFRREVYDLVGGFDERYKCFYEELDFGVSLRQKGYEHFIATYPILYHMGGATTSEPKNMDARADLENSRAAFRAKWGATPGEIRTQFDGVKTIDNNPIREWSTALVNVEE
jgi:GT2 family glycosyltransferase